MRQRDTAPPPPAYLEVLVRATASERATST
jgi:hypothetical protein